MEYDDGLIACASDELVIRRYNLVLGSRRVPYGRIRKVTQARLNLFNKWRIWGSGDFRHWFNFDAGRPRKHVVLVLDVGRGMKPAITPDDPEEVVAVLRRHGVEVQGVRPRQG